MMDIILKVQDIRLKELDIKLKELEIEQNLEERRDRKPTHRNFASKQKRTTTPKNDGPDF